MIRTKNKPNYAIGHEDGNKGWGLKAWNMALQALLCIKGIRGDRILLFTKQGLQPRYYWHQNEWKERL